jgi:hypothetical protein
MHTWYLHAMIGLQMLVQPAALSDTFTTRTATVTTTAADKDDADEDEPQESKKA